MTTALPDWYARRDELEPWQVFRTADGSIVKLDRRVPGDATAWTVADWWNGWVYMETRIEPGDLVERLPDDHGEPPKPEHQEGSQ